MKIFIPTIGTKLKLAADWKITVHPEYRNHDLYELALGKEVTDYLWLNDSKYQPMPFIIPSGVILAVDRIYIKKGAPDFDSVTFRIPSLKSGGFCPRELSGLRFWVKLAEVNTMEADVI